MKKSPSKKTLSRQDLIQRLEQLEERDRLKRELPHLYAFPDYNFSKEFKSSTNRMRFICAGNQLSKSSTAIQDCIEKACKRKDWKKFFKKRDPKTFWYIYPTQDKIDEEITTKWPEFLPTGSEKESGQYSWKQTKVGKNKAIKFLESCVIVIFKSWRSDLQAGTVDGVWCDEEIPCDIYPELAMRLSRYDGMFAMVFTATLNQPFWYDVIERIGEKDERFPQAAKWQVSAEYDCEFYADGTSSPWTPEKVAAQKAICGSQIEIDRRIHGRFVTEQGLKYPEFDEDVNIVEIPKDRNLSTWLFYSGVDIGSGGKSGHPAAIAIIAVRPDYKLAQVFKLWKGNKFETTNAADILEKYNELTRGLPMTGEFYDWASKEFGIVAERHGYTFQKAVKFKDEDSLNLLFKNRMLEFERGGEFVDEMKLELKTLKVGVSKQKANDHLCDALRYATSSVPWNIDHIKSNTLLDSLNHKPKNERLGRNYIEPPFLDDDESLDEQINELNDLAGGFF